MAKRCSSCRQPGHDRRTCGRVRAAPKPKPYDPWADLEWEEHPEAQAAVGEHRDGMTLEQVGALLGVTRERVRQIEAAALHKIQTGEGAGDVIEVTGERTGEKLAIPLTRCEACGDFFPRRGRAVLCEPCTPAPVPAAVPKVEAAVPAPAPDFPGFAVVFDFGGLGDLAAA